MHMPRLTTRRVLSTRARSSRSFILAASIFAICAPQAHTATWSWLNNTGNWNDPLQWTDDSLANTVPVSGTTTDLLFGGSGAVGYTSTNNLANPFILNTLTLNSSATAGQTISGSDLDFRIDDVGAQIVQNGSGSFTISNGIILTDPLTLAGSGAGITELTGVISGGGGLLTTGGYWRLTNTGNTFTGGLNVGLNSFVELAPTGTNAPVNIAPAANRIIGSNSAANVLTIDGGTLKFTTSGTGNIVFGNNRALTFGANGGTLNLHNSNTGTTQGGGMAGGDNDLALTLNNSGGNVAVIQFNGGQNGISNNGAVDGNFSGGNNVLRIESYAGTGPLRIELDNGAAWSNRNANVNVPVTIRGVAGGDPTSGPLGTINANISRVTGRMMVDVQGTHNFNQGITIEDAVQFAVVGTARAFNGNITIAGTSSGHPGYAVFSGRGTGTDLAATIRPAGHGGTGDTGMYPLYIGVGGNDVLTIENGGIAVFDSRVRHEQENNNGVLMNGRAVIQGGGELRVYQSLSRATAILAAAAGQTGTNSTGSLAGHHVIDGNIQGEGSTASEALLNIYLPLPSGSDTNGDEVPDTFGDFGGVVFRNSSNLIINGTGFGGLRVNGKSRPNALFAGGAPDPVSNAAKVENLLTTARINALTGSAGYLTIAPDGSTYTFPNAEWDGGVNVGLKATDHTSGVDLQFDPAKTSWSHNLAVDAGAELSTGAAPFTLSAGTLHGTGTISGTGGLTIAAGATVSPGLGGIGTLTVGDFTLDGTFALDVTNSPSVDLLNAGSLTLGATSILDVNAGSTFNNGTYTIATYSGSLTGTFNSVVGLPLGYSVNYATANQIRLMFTPVQTLTWRGTPGSIWSINGADANWQGNQSFSNGAAVVFNDTVGAGSTTINLNGTVSPGAVTFDNTAVDYTVVGGAGNSIGGSATLIKNGTGSLTISGPNTYTGGTDINAGTLRLAANDTLPDIGTVTVAPGAVLDVNGQIDTIDRLIVNGAITGGNLTVGSLAIGGSGSLPTNFVLQGNITKTGASSATMSGNVNLDAGTRVFNVETGNSPELTISGTLSNGGLTKAGAGTLVLSNASNNFATIEIDAGTVSTDDNDLSVTSFSGTGGTLDLGSGSLTVDQSSNTTFAGSITGLGATLTKNGPGNVRLTAGSTFSGGVELNGGVLSVNAGTAAGSGDIAVNTGGSLDVGTSIGNTINLNGGLLGASGGSGTLVNGTVNVLADSVLRNADPENLATENELDIRGTLQGSANLLVQTNNGDGSADNGPGVRLRGTGISNYSGTITVANSTKFELQTSVAGPFSPAGTGTIRLTAGTITGGLNGTYSEINLRNNSGGNAILGNDVEVLGTGVVNFGPVGGAPAASRITLGNLKIGAGQTAGANRNGTAGVSAFVVGFSNVTLTGGSATFAPNTVGIGFSSTTDLALGAIGEDVPGSGIVMDGQGVLYLEEANTYTGPTVIQRGTTRLGATGALPAATALTVTSGTLDLTHPTLGSFDQTVATLAGAGGTITNSGVTEQTLTVNQSGASVFSGALTGNLGLTKQGSGILTLAGGNTFTGETTISAGTLLVTGSVAGSINVDGGTLGGNGSVGAVIVNGGTIAPGESPGVLLTGNVQLNALSIFSAEILGTAPGVGYDRIAVTGSVELGTPVTLSLGVNPGTFDPADNVDIFTIILNDGLDAVVGTFAGLPNGGEFSAGGQAFRISYFDDASTAGFELAGGNDVSLLAIPEPATPTILLAGLTVLAGLRRKRR